MADNYGVHVAAKLVTGDLAKILKSLKQSDFKAKDYMLDKNMRLIDKVRYGVFGKTFAQLEPIIEAAEHDKEILKARREL